MRRLITAAMLSLAIMAYAGPPIITDLPADFQQTQELQDQSFVQGAGVSLQYRVGARSKWLDLSPYGARWEGRSSGTSTQAVQAVATVVTSTTPHYFAIELDSDQTGTSVSDWVYSVIVTEDGIDYPLGTGSLSIAESTWTGASAILTSTTSKVYTDAQIAALSNVYETVATNGEGTAGQVLATDGSGSNYWADAGAGSVVTKVGTPVDNQVGVWTGDGTLEGDSGLTWDGATLAATSMNVSSNGAYLYNGSTAFRLATGNDTFYGATLAGAGAGATTPEGIAKQTATGYQAGQQNTGANQTATGYFAGYLNEGASQTAMGSSAGQENTGANQTATGYLAGYRNEGANQTAVGVLAGFENTGANQTATGYFAGQENTGASQTAMGYLAGYLNEGANQTAMGYRAGRENTGDNTVFLGYQAGYLNTRANAFILRHSVASAIPLLEGDFATGDLWLPDGNLGIGTNAPAAKLHVNGDAKIDGGLNMSGTTITDMADGVADTDAATVGQLAWQTTHEALSGTTPELSGDASSYTLTTSAPTTISLASGFTHGRDSALTVYGTNSLTMPVEWDVLNSADLTGTNIFATIYQGGTNYNVIQWSK